VTAPLLVIASHGSLGRAALESARQIFGPIEPAVALALEPSGRLEEIEKGIDEARERYGLDRPVILLVDLFGGSCSNVAAKILKRPGDAGIGVRVIAGFNLAMLIEYAFSREKFDIDGLADRMIEAGRKACLDVNGKVRGVGARAPAAPTVAAAPAPASAPAAPSARAARPESAPDSLPPSVMPPQPGPRPGPGVGPQTGGKS
jgi:mannose/fructose-specific phosphotransferase system component IIA